MTRFHKIGEVAKSFLGTVEERVAVGGVDVLGLATGFAKIDEWTGGIQKDEMWIIGARTSVGKTALALDIALHNARQGKITLLYSLEMRAETLVNRLLSRMTEVPAARIVRGKLDADELKRVRAASESLARTKIAIVDDSLTVDELRADAFATKEAIGIDLVIVDYAGMLADPAPKGETERMNHISKTIRNLARANELDCGIVLLAQLNRASETREDHTPQLSDLKSSGSLEQDANVVLFPYRPYLYERMRGAEPKLIERDAQIIVAKNREGITGSTHATFYADQVRWEQKPTQPVEPKPIQSLAAKVREKRAA